MNWKIKSKFKKLVVKNCTAATAPTATGKSGPQFKLPPGPICTIKSGAAGLINQGTLPFPIINILAENGAHWGLAPSRLPPVK